MNYFLITLACTMAAVGLASSALYVTGYVVPACSGKDCKADGWWRMVVVVRGAGKTPRALYLLRYRTVILCATCAAKMNPQHFVPRLEGRQHIGAKAEAEHGQRPDWSKTILQFRHVWFGVLKRS